jgi:hypothetical protein
MTTITSTWISGLCFGIEFFDDEEHGNGMLLDLFIIRVLFFFGDKSE